ncbi:MAG TPA: hypothetical protein G4N94_06265 [Caldilineae bacterium]|nr:hypothetical protein [Caldilineae bacterium]
MFRYLVQQRKWALVAIVFMGILVALSATSASATPFDSPPPKNTIHEPLVTNKSGEPAPQPARVESLGIPVGWILLLLLLLFIPAATFVTARRR